MASEIILIGPVAAGKTTVGKLLAARLEIPLVSMDDLRFGYYQELGYDEEFARELREREGPMAVYRYWKVFDPYSVERLLAEHSDCVFDFGGGSSVHEFDDQLARVQRALEPYENVVLLLPSADEDESVRILSERTGGCGHRGWHLNAHFVRHRSNRLLAKFVVYTRGKTPAETCDEVLGLVSRA